MNRIAVFAIAALMSVGLAGGAWGADQPASAPASKPAMRHPGFRLVGKVLNLTDDQKTKIKGILKAAHADAGQVADKDAKRAIWKAAFENIRKNVLTDDQRVKLQQLHQRRENIKALNLTDGQKARIREIVKTAHADADKAAGKDAKKAIWKAAFDKVKSDVLTDAQRQQLAQMKAAHKEAPAKNAPATAPAPAK